MRIYVVEQSTSDLYGSYLTEAMVIAANKTQATAAVVQTGKYFGLKVVKARLRVVDFGPAPDPLPRITERWRHGDALVMVVGHDDEPDPNDFLASA
jgi:hypothetical protein